MKRRDFITLVGCAMIFPLVTQAQQSALPVIGFLSAGSPVAFEPFVVAFRRGLGDMGFNDGRVAIESRWAEGQNDRLPTLANDLVRAGVSVLVAGGPPAALAAKGATSSIPVVFTSGADPVKMGLVASYNLPGGNVTGVVVSIDALGAKRFGLLRSLVPSTALIAVLLNPTEPSFETQLKDIQEAARAVGQSIQVLRASTEREIDSAFVAATEARAGAMLVGVSFFFTIRREQLVALAARARLPTIYGQREFMSVGGLISYATDLTEAYRQAGVYTGRILRGTQPADLPVAQLSKFELVINLKTAEALGLTIPSSVFSIADEVID
jgi:putative tryptophan/tyrosine transport system substrate-binding protein